ncbi:MAG: alpha/beta fold hydrolase [Nocardioidaceae bacterium]
MTEQNRKDIAFASGKERCAAWLYLPEGASADHKVPIIVMAHGLGGVRRARLDAFAERFCAAGYACLVFDYRHFGDSTGMPRELLRVPLQREDYHAAIAHARTIPEVDPERVVLWGTSFSGGHVIVTAAEDPRVVAAIAQCPFTDGIASVLAINPIVSAKLTVLATQDAALAASGKGLVRVPLVGAPGETALMTAPDAKPGYEAVWRRLAMTCRLGWPHAWSSTYSAPALAPRPKIVCPIMLRCASPTVWLRPRRLCATLPRRPRVRSRCTTQGTSTSTSTTSSRSWPTNSTS